MKIWCFIMALTQIVVTGDLGTEVEIVVVRVVEIVAVVVIVAAAVVDSSSCNNSITVAILICK